MWVKPWLPDYVVIIPTESWKVLCFIEMKAKWWTVSKHQKAWLNAFGWCVWVEVSVCYWVEDVMLFIQQVIKKYAKKAIENSVEKNKSK